MVVLTALRSALAGLARNPVLIAVAGVLALVQLPQLASRALGPLAASLVSLLSSVVLVVVMPFFQAGLYGMAEEALEGRTRLGTFVATGKAHYVPMLVAYVLLFAVLFVYWIVVVVLALVFLVVVLGTGESPLANPAVLAVGLGLAAVVALLYLGFGFFVQFYGQAIVVDDLATIAGYRRSVRLVRRNLRPALGYSVLAGAPGVLFVGIGTVAVVLLSPQQAELLSLPTLSTGGAVAAAALVVALTALSTAFFVTFSVAFYRGLSSRDAAGGAVGAAG